MERCIDQIRPSFGCGIPFAFRSPSKDRKKIMDTSSEIKLAVISSRIHSFKKELLEYSDCHGFTPVPSSGCTSDCTVVLLYRNLVWIERWVTV